MRHALSILILPVTVTVLIPLWISRRSDFAAEWPQTTTDVLLVIAGAAVLLIGLTLFAASLHNFFVRGRGTLAPWDPPRRLVVDGPYRYVRNPMISGVVLILIGTSLVLRSRPHATWALTFFVINAIYIPFLEEPFLEQRFGEDYREYCRHVPRLLPRLRPWRG